MTDPAPPRRPLARWTRPGLALVLIVAGILGAWYWFSPAPPRPAEDAPPGPPPDPRVAFETPFRNVRPGVRYVGDAACAGCHDAIDKSYHAHPMGRSAEVVGKAPSLERFGPAAHDPFTLGAYTLRAERTADGLVQHVSATGAAGKPLPEYAQSAVVAIGSGTRGRSYLAVQDGAAWQMVLSWFARGERWDVSPGFDLGWGGRRAVAESCLFCHVNRVELIPGTENRFREPLLAGQANVGCERCHGPGELHVAARLSGDDPGGVDSTIVNPKHLSAALRGDVCRQCHLQGEARVVRRGRALAEYRPGLPWDQFVTTFLRRPDLADYHKSVGQFEQLEVSKCFISSGGKLGCVSCHDPHAKPAPAEADRFYRGRCLTCHDSRGCSAPAAERAARKDSCVACHMPRADSSSIAHAAVTDHRILRRPAPAGAPHASPGAVPVVAYPAGPHAPPAEERERDLGVALVRQAEKYGPTVGRAAARQLSAAVGRWPDDAVAWSSLAYVLGTPKPTDAALRAARTAVELTPHSEAAQRVLADLAVRGGDAETGVAAAGEAIRLNPSSVEHRLLRAAAYLLRGRYAEAEADCRAALAIHPLHPEAWMYLAVARHKQGDAAGARQHADTALRLTTSPRMRDYYRDWFAAKTR
jgi:hypothetical protein